LVHASNVTGTLLPVEAVARVVKERGIALLVDAAQTIGVLPFTVQELGADLLAFPGHKGLLGPQGTGGLYVGQGVELRPLKAGGTGRESLLEVMPPALPDRFEAGTANVPGISGLGAGVEFVLREGVARIREREMALSEYTLAGLRSIPKVEVYGPRDAESRIGVISFNVSGLGPEQVAYALDEAYGIMVRAGLHCAPCAHRTIGTLDKGTVRVGLGLFNTVEDIDRLLEAVRGVAEVV
jgi:selenocysteine lyase/cysteine desulfurase